MKKLMKGIGKNWEGTCGSIWKNLWKELRKTGNELVKATGEKMEVIGRELKRNSD